MTYLEHKLYPLGVISVCFRQDDGTLYRYCLQPGDDLEGQPEAVTETAAAAWTAEVIAAFEEVRASND